MAIRNIVQGIFPEEYQARARSVTPIQPPLERPEPLSALERRLGVETDPRLAFLDSLLCSPHGRLAEYRAVHERVLATDRNFYAHLAAWYHSNGIVEDQRQLFCAHLAVSPEQEHREAAFVMLQRLRTYQLARVVRYMKETLRTVPRRTRSAVRWWLDRRERDPAWFDEVALRDRRNLKYLYATLRIAPSTRAGRILFESDPPPDSRLAAVKRLAHETDGAVVAEGIVRNRIFASTAVGLLKRLDAQALAALISVMSPQQLMNALRSLERRGALAHPDLKRLIQDKLQRAAVAPRLQAARSLTAAGVIEDEATKQQLATVAADRLRRLGTISRPTAIFVDKSGSMERALELGAHVSALACTIAEGEPCVWAFDAFARAVRPKRPDRHLAAWTEAFGRLSADGQTSIGVPFAALTCAGQRVEQVVVVTDGEENSAPFFAPSLREYEQAMGTKVSVVVVLVNGRRGHNALERSLNENGVEAATWVFDGDLYSLPNLVPFLVTPRRALLCAQILDTPLPTLADLDRLPPGFDPVTCELL
jgi:hypothetical protein